MSGTVSEFAWPEDPTRCAIYGSRLEQCSGPKCGRYSECPAHPKMLNEIHVRNAMMDLLHDMSRRGWIDGAQFDEAETAVNRIMEAL